MVERNRASFKWLMVRNLHWSSETFARRFDVLDGGVVELETPSGKKKISPLGIFCDYGNEFGMAAIDQTEMDRLGGHGPSNKCQSLS